MDESVRKTISGFEESFLEDDYYNLQTQDAEHLSLILENLNISSGKRILDLGTGTGYLAFPIAEKYKGCRIIGLDVVERTIDRNNGRVEIKGLKNLIFRSYEGFNFPFEDESFDIIISRYAIHHFPDIELCFKEISRTLKTGGQLFISDPTPKDIDQGRFVDRYMQMRDDGHIKFLQLSEMEGLGNQHGLVKEVCHISQIRFPRKGSDKYLPLLQSTDEDILKAYEIEIRDDEIYITEDVLNISFIKQKG